MHHVTTTEGEQKYSIFIDFFKFGFTPILNAYAYPRFYTYYFFQFVIAFLLLNHVIMISFILNLRHGWNRLAKQSQILCEASIEWGNQCVYK